MEIRQPQSAEEWEMYYDLRFRILREPLGKERGSERNEGDANGQHLALFNAGKLFAIARLDSISSTICQVRFVAVEGNHQGEGFGKLIMQAAEELGKNLGHQTMVLHARDYALPFYEKLGFMNHGPSYVLFDTLQHYEMSKPI